MTKKKKRQLGFGILAGKELPNTLAFKTRFQIDLKVCSVILVGSWALAVRLPKCFSNILIVGSKVSQISFHSC